MMFRIGGRGGGKGGLGLGWGCEERGGGAVMRVWVAGNVGT